MIAFLKGLGILLASFLVLAILAISAPRIAIWLTSGLLVLSLVASVRRLPALRLGHRGFNIALALFVAFPTWAASLGALQGLQGADLAALKVENPEAYLAELRRTDEQRWLDELAELDPARHVSEMQARAAARAVAESRAKAAEQERIAAENQRLAAEQARLEAQRAEALKKRQAEREAERQSYMDQLERELASMPGISARDYISSVDRINTALLLIGAWTKLYEDLETMDLSGAQEDKRQEFRSMLVRKQAEMFPVLRDAYGPAMRRELWEADSSARTIGTGFRTVEFVSPVFVRNANIKQIHTEIRENLMMLRFNRANYKWIRDAYEYSYYTLEAPSDTDLVMWQSGGRYRVIR